MMGNIIHRKGRRYRVWSTYTDTYITGPMSRGQMTRHLVRCATREFEGRILQDTEVRMERASKKGTSSLVGSPRDGTKWDTERCQCGNFHHTFELRASDGKCSHCGEPEDDTSHKPPCKEADATP